MGDAVLVTGAAGFVGSAVVRRLADTITNRHLDLGGSIPIRRVIGLVRPGSEWPRLAELRPGPAWSMVEADLGRADEVLSALDRTGPVAIVHTALAREAYGVQTDAEAEKVALGPLENLVTAASAVGARRIVHAGSAWVLPGGEALHEGTPSAPTSPYGRVKAIEDTKLPTLAERHGLEWLNLRLFNLFGRHERPERLIPYLVDRLSRGRPAELADGERVRDFTDVDLMSEAFELALRASPAAADSLYHLGTGRGWSIRMMAELVAGVTGGVELIQFGRRSTPDTLAVQVADVGHARTMLGWSPPDDLPARVREVTRWWLGRVTDDEGVAA
jgi:UDP-glucose 4-epimerase